MENYFNIKGLYFLLLLSLGAACAPNDEELINNVVDDDNVGIFFDAGIANDIGVVDLGFGREDAAIEDIAVADVAIEDTAIEDAAIEDTAIEDVAVQTAPTATIVFPPQSSSVEQPGTMTIRGTATDAEGE